jgi:hypothetical protein
LRPLEQRVLVIGIISGVGPQDKPDDDGLPDWLDPIYDEDDPREYMQVLSPAQDRPWFNLDTNETGIRSAYDGRGAPTNLFPRG